MLRDFVEVACLPELPGQDPGQFGLVSITYTASIKLLELLANFAVLSCAFHYSFSRLVLFLVLEIVLMIVLFLVLKIVRMIVLFLVLNFVFMIVFFLVLNFVLMIVLFLVLNFVLMIVPVLVLMIVLF